MEFVEMGKQDGKTLMLLPGTALQAIDEFMDLRSERRPMR